MMTDREKHLSLALDALVQARETFDLYSYTMPPVACRAIRDDLRTATANIEAAAIPRVGIIRRWFGRKAEAAA